MILADCHTHCSYSTDSDASPVSMVEGALKKGLSAICFTDHMDLDYPYGEVFEFDADEYISYINGLNKRYEGRIHVLAGMEAGMQPQVAAMLYELSAKDGFDMILGSQHVSHGEDPYHESAFYGKDPSEVYRLYFEDLLENINIFNDFDTLAHLDYAARYGPSPVYDEIFNNNIDVIDGILIFLIKNGKSMEINTSGLVKGTHDFNPGRTVLSRYKELGGSEITIGSDAHRPEDLGFAFDKAITLLKELGFDHYNYYIKRKPVRVEIS